MIASQGMFVPHVEDDLSFDISCYILCCNPRKGVRSQKHMKHPLSSAEASYSPTLTANCFPHSGFLSPVFSLPYFSFTGVY